MAKFFSIIGIITMVLSGGCSLGGVLNGVAVPIVMVVGGLPFLAGLIVFFYSSKAIQSRDKDREQP